VPYLFNKKVKELQPLSGQVYLQIKSLILRNEIMPGQKLHHQALSDRLGVSRTPVREALSRLVQEGYVTLLPNRDFVCKEIGLQEAEELYDLRECLEVFAIEKAILNAGDRALEKLRQKIDLYGSDTRRRFTRERLIYDRDIHLEIARISGNETLRRALIQVFERIILKRKTDGLYDLARGASAHQEHLQLLEALRGRNVNAAVRNIREHVQQGKGHVLADLRQKQEIRDSQFVESAG
jgi:DNA-binding GntR family transcriptional regulator